VGTVTETGADVVRFAAAVEEVWRNLHRGGTLRPRPTTDAAGTPPLLRNRAWLQVDDIVRELQPRARRGRTVIMVCLDGRLYGAGHKAIPAGAFWGRSRGSAPFEDAPLPAAYEPFLSPGSVGCPCDSEGLRVTFAASHLEFALALPGHVAEGPDGRLRYFPAGARAVAHFSRDEWAQWLLGPSMSPPAPPPLRYDPAPGAAARHILPQFVAHGSRAVCLANEGHRIAAEEDLDWPSLVIRLLVETARVLKLGGGDSEPRGFRRLCETGAQIVSGRQARQLAAAGVELVRWRVAERGATEVRPSRRMEG
jgi:hypothetical protein